MKTLRLFGCLAIVTLMANPSLAQTLAIPQDAVVAKRPPPHPPKAGPAPLIGVGLPMVGTVLAALLLARRVRRRA